MLSNCATLSAILLATFLTGTQGGLLSNIFSSEKEVPLIDIDSVKQCVEDRIASGKRYRRKNEEEMFHLDFGDAALEVFHAMSVNDLKQIEYLNTCTMQYDERSYSIEGPPLFHDRSLLGSRNITHGGSNVTHLTGLFQAVLPEVEEKIRRAATESMSESHQQALYLAAIHEEENGVKKFEAHNKWEVDFSTLGIRSVQYQTFEYKQKAMTLSERRRAVLEMRKKETDKVMKMGEEHAPKTIIGGEMISPAQIKTAEDQIRQIEEKEIQWEIERKARMERAQIREMKIASAISLSHQELVIAEMDAKAEREEERLKREAERIGEKFTLPHEHDDLSDAHIADYMDTDKGTIYTMVILLSDRTHFSGGEIFVKKVRDGEEEVEVPGGGVVGGSNMRGSGSSDSVGGGDGDVDVVEEDEYDEEDAVDVGEVVGTEKITSRDGHEAPTDKYDRYRKRHTDGRGGYKTRHRGYELNVQLNTPGKDEDGNLIYDPRIYNAFLTRISRFTPDKGSLLLIRNDFQHGMQPVINGRRHALVVEYWQYQDATAEERRPSVSQGRPLKQRWQEL